MGREGVDVWREQQRVAERAGVARTGIVEQDDNHVGTVNDRKRSRAYVTRPSRRTDGRPKRPERPVVPQGHAEHDKDRAR